MAGVAVAVAVAESVVMVFGPVLAPFASAGITAMEFGSGLAALDWAAASGSGDRLIVT